MDRHVATLLAMTSDGGTAYTGVHTNPPIFPGAEHLFGLRLRLARSADLANVQTSLLFSSTPMKNNSLVCGPNLFRIRTLSVAALALISGVLPALAV